MVRWLKYIIGVALIACLLWDEGRHWQELKNLPNLSLKQLASMYSLCFLATIVTARVVQYLIGAL